MLRQLGRILAIAVTALFATVAVVAPGDDRLSSAIRAGKECLIGQDGLGPFAGKKVKGCKRHTLVDTLGPLLKAEVHSAGV